jgi:hypothetical protein
VTDRSSVPAPPRFPIALKDAALEPSDAPVRYVVAANGVFVERRTPLFTATVPVEAVPGLLPHQARLALHVPPLPGALVERAVGFFREVWIRWGGEAIVVLHATLPRSGRPVRYALDAPPQRLHGRFERGRFRAELRLEYGTCDKPGAEWVRLGTIHSHGPAGPAHSAVDAHDELYDTGLHVTAGYVDTRRPAFRAAFVVGGTRFAVPEGQVLAPFGAPRRPPPEWLARVTASCDARSWEHDVRGAGRPEDGGHGGSGTAH